MKNCILIVALIQAACFGLPSNAPGYSVSLSLGTGSNLQTVQIWVSNRVLAQYFNRSEIQVGLGPMTRREYGLRGRLLLEDSNFSAKLPEKNLADLQKDPESLFYQMGVYYERSLTPFALNKKTEREKMAEFQKQATGSGLGPDSDLFLYRQIGDSYKRTPPGFPFESPHERLQEAKRSYQNYLVNFPNGPHADEALFKIATCEWRSGNPKAALVSLGAHVAFRLEREGIQQTDLSDQITERIQKLLPKTSGDTPGCEWEFTRTGTLSLKAVTYDKPSRQIKIEVTR